MTRLLLMLLFYNPVYSQSSWPYCISTPPNRGIVPVNNNRCQRCVAIDTTAQYAYAWYWKRDPPVCGCDVLYSCGTRNNSLCNTIMGSLFSTTITSPLPAIYDNNPDTSAGRASAWIMYDLEYPRKVAGGIVKGNDGFYWSAAMYKVTVGNSFNNPSSNSLCHMNGDNGLQYTMNYGFFTCNAVGRYVTLWRDDTMNWRDYGGTTFAVWEFRVFEDAGNMPYGTGQCQTCGGSDNLIGSTCTSC